MNQIVADYLLACDVAKKIRRQLHRCSESKVTEKLHRLAAQAELCANDIAQEACPSQVTQKDFLESLTLQLSG